MSTKSRATIEDLACVEGKAEIVDGEVVRMSPTGSARGYACDEIYVSLREYARRTRRGRAVGDNKAFRVDLPDRDSFSPDAAYHVGPDTGMSFYRGAPAFAAEVRSAEDDGPAADRRIAKKRRDYFAAGTLVVWDVDLRSPDVVKVYRANSPRTKTVYRRGARAEAEPAGPGWSMAVDDLFP